MGIKISKQFQSAMRGLLFVCTAWSEDQYKSVRSGMACVGHAKNIALSPVCSTPPWGSWACGPWLCVQRRSSSGTRRSWNASDCDTYHEEIARRKSDTKSNISQGDNSNSQAIIYTQNQLSINLSNAMNRYPMWCVYVRVEQHIYDPFLRPPKELSFSLPVKESQTRSQTFANLPSKYVKQYYGFAKNNSVT